MSDPVILLDKAATLALVLVNLAIRHQQLTPEVNAIADAMWKEGRRVPNEAEQAQLQAIVMASRQYRDEQIARKEAGQG
jgi:hypothetical protein